MKEVFVIFGRGEWSSGVFEDDRYFGETPILELYSDADQALARFKDLIKSAFEIFKDYTPPVLDEECVNDAFQAELFADYNLGKDEFPEGDVQWEYIPWDGEFAKWQMYPVNIPWDFECPILAGIYLEKMPIY